MNIISGNYALWCGLWCPSFWHPALCWNTTLESSTYHHDKVNNPQCHKCWWCAGIACSNNIGTCIAPKSSACWAVAITTSILPDTAFYKAAAIFRLMQQQGQGKRSQPKKSTQQRKATNLLQMTRHHQIPGWGRVKNRPGINWPNTQMNYNFCGYNTPPIIVFWCNNIFFTQEG